MTRDLMPQFIRLHEQSYQQSSEDEERDFLMEVDEPFVDHHLPDDVEDFLLMITELHQRVEQIHVLLADLKKHQGEIISEIHMNKRLHEEHDILVSEIKKESSSVNEQIKRLKVVVEGEKRDGYITTEGKMKRDQVNVLVLIFQEVMEEFNRTQIEHRDHCKSRIKRQFEICGHDVDGEDIEEMLENNEVNVFTKHLGIDDLAKTQNALREVENRHADILKLEKSITVWRDRIP
ncbi:syntaxin-1A-like [Clytia hemisphaerica]|uniref:syntaxin-1A-like n=1 Tax=Clytia hemisphaerica TaxID=252671 RepID=UPI0034D649E8